MKWDRDPTSSYGYSMCIVNKISLIFTSSFNDLIPDSAGFFNFETNFFIAPSIVISGFFTLSLLIPPKHITFFFVKCL